MKIKLIQDDAQEVLHKMSILADSEDLRDDYKLTQAQANAMRDSVPHAGGEWDVPAWAIEAVKGEMVDHVVVLRGISDDARSSNEIGQALHIAKQAKRLARLFALES